MTKKHFIALAKTIKEHNARGETGQFNLNHLYVLARFCSEQNSRFNEDRWLNYIEGTHGPNGGKL